ncbi:rust resistance kinase Lr10 [Coffea arabica]|uniref:Rust resistance kinase Lr10-like n=1 Tax=Coffea arabica TaxID=13443 RepID=A0A6P6VYH8_COFAR|nr:rust resistance kinase Lr10-like [Coffea arabica]XP_027106958.1 rust resistance kinase Lr10-like [Coffea arabica]
MVILNVVRLIFLATLTALGSCKIHDNCTVRRCSDQGPAIRFPFRLKDRQPQHCGFPGFELSCTQSQETVLENPFRVKASLNQTKPPFSVKFVINKIDYESRLLYVAKLDGCLPGLLPKLDLSASLFQIPDFNDYDFSFFKCSSKKWYMIPIPCLSNSSYQVYATQSTDSILFASLVSCTKMFEIPSVSYALIEPQIPLVLSWSAPNCGYCEAEDKFCRLRKSSSSAGIQCLENGTGPLKKIKVTGMVLGPALIVLIGIASYRIFRSKKLKKEDQLKIGQFLEDYKALKPSRYSYSDIKKITGNFSEKLGEGGYGTVYKGKLSNEVFVAVKVLNNSKGGGEDFINEVGTIGQIHHVNIVRLVGYCADGYRGVLVYEFLPNHSLEKFTSSENERNLLGLEKLHNIALGIAKGIEYLHQGCEQRILHFDIKPHNILLDQNFNPKISDFGQAKLCSKEQSAVSMTAARGTMGYIAPEVFSRNFGKVSHKSDVYSFGMLLIEMVGGRKNIKIGGQDNSAEAYFPEWIYNKLDQGEEITIQIDNEDDKITAKKLMIIGLWCIQWYPVDRPSMKAVIQMLEAEEPPSMPRNPFGSTNTINERATLGGGTFVNELKSISESESEES